MNNPYSSPYKSEIPKTCYSPVNVSDYCRETDKCTWFAEFTGHLRIVCAHCKDTKEVFQPIDKDHIGVRTGLNVEYSKNPIKHILQLNKAFIVAAQ
jgi:hypothetical protein